jgi:hypothetical protein
LDFSASLRLSVKVSAFFGVLVVNGSVLSFYLVVWTNKKPPNFVAITVDSQPHYFYPA